MMVGVERWRVKVKNEGRGVCMSNKTGIPVTNHCLM